MGFLNQSFDHYLKFFLFFITVYTILRLFVRPYLRLRLLKAKYGDKVETYFFPYLGIQYLFVTGKNKEDIAEEIYIRFRKKNPKAKVLISNFGGEVYYQLLDPEMIHKFALSQDNYKKFEGILFLDEVF